jgi:hypothetical protein
MLATCQWVNATGTWRKEMHMDFVGWSLKLQLRDLDLGVKYLRGSNLCWKNLECIYLAQNRN